MMRVFIILSLLMVFCVGQVSAQMTTDSTSNFVLVEYAPKANHLSEDDAPAGGYNEDNDIVMIKLGREYAWKGNWKRAVTIGYTNFDNSYGEDSNGLGVGAEAIYVFNSSTSFYAGGDFGFVSGYDGHVDDDFVIFSDYIPFLSLNTGFEYAFNEWLPTIRGGLKYIPASWVDSDDVVALTVGTRIKF